MLTGLVREVRWREVTDVRPAKRGYVLVTQSRYSPSGSREESGSVCRPAYWDGREFQDPDGKFPIRTVTHWMPFPRLPDAEAIRRVFRALLGEESSC